MQKDSLIEKISKQEIRSVSDYINTIALFINAKKEEGVTFLYRGEPQVYDDYCKPNIFRKNILFTNEFYEMSLLNAMRQNKLSDKSSYLENAIDAQHGEFPSRLLDVSYNCLNALYFAVTPYYHKKETEYDEYDGMVYIFYIEDIFSPSAKNSNDNFDAIINKDKKWFNNYVIFEKNHKFIDHTKINSRIIAQQGAFILFQGNDPESIPTYMMNGIVIPKGAKPKLREELSLMFGINTGSIYPETVNLVNDITHKSKKIRTENFNCKNEFKYVIKNLKKELGYYYDYICSIDVEDDSVVFETVCHVEKVINSYRIGLYDFFNDLDNLKINDFEGDVDKEKIKSFLVEEFNKTVKEFENKISKIKDIPPLSDLTLK